MSAEDLFEGPEDDQQRERIVLHVDMDCFYAACERRREPELEGEPVVIGMGYDEENPSGAVATASYEAREHGIESAQPIADAIQRLPPRHHDTADDQPTAYYRPVDMEYYSEVSKSVHEVLSEYSETIRKVSIDEAYLDVSDRVDWSSVESFAESLKTHIAEAVGVTASVGVAPNMSTAKIASDREKPDGLVVVPPDNVAEFLAPLSVEAIHGVGPVTASKLRDLGIETAGDIAETDPAVLEDHFGDNGRALHRRARGIDPREVTPRGNPKSLSRERSFDPTTEMERKRELVRQLAQSVHERARSKDARYQTIGIKVVTTPYSVQTREESLSGPIRDGELLERKALELVEEFADATVRKLGVRVSNLDFTEGEQIQLDSWTPPDWAIREDGARDETGPGPGQTRLTDFL